MTTLSFSKAGGIPSDGKAVGESYSNLPQRDVHTWTSLMLQQAKHGQGRRAFRMYEEMQKEGIEPIPRTFVALLKACSSLQDLESAKRVHADVCARGFDADLYVSTMLVDAYAKCRSLMDAKNVFDRMPRRDAVSWNAMMFGYAQMDKGEEALELYTRMKQEGVVPQERTYISALKACNAMVQSGNGDSSALKERCLRTVRVIHRDMACRNFEMGLFVGTMLVDAYAKCGSLDDARLVFEQMRCRDVVSWNAMILGYAQMEQGEEALQLYSRMLQEGVPPDDRTYVGAIKACSALLVSGNKSCSNGVGAKCLETVRGIHANVRKSNFQSDLFVGNMLVDVYAKCGTLDDARRVFDSMPCHDVVSWNALILGYAQLGKGEQALQFYTQMQHEGVLRDKRTYVGALKACSSILESREQSQTATKESCLEIVQAIHKDIMKGKVDEDVFVGNVLIDVYAKCGSLENARQVFENMPLRTKVSWNTMIAGCTQMGRAEEALKLYLRMQEDGVVPDDWACVSALKACCIMADSCDGQTGRETCLQVTRAIHADAVKGKLELGLFAETMLVDAYAKCGSLEDARDIFENMCRRDVISWNAMISGYVQLGKGEEALGLYGRMRLEGLVPDEQTHVSALKACSTVVESGERNEAERRVVKEQCLKSVRAIHTDLVDGKFSVGAFVGTSLVDAYAKCGSLENARLVFEKMHNRSVASWNAMILSYAQLGKAEEALQLYTQMQEEGVAPDGLTYGGALKACSSIAELNMSNGCEDIAAPEKCLETVKAIHANIEQRNLGMDAYVGNMLVDAYVRFGCLEDARRVFEKMPHRDVVSWNTMMYGYLQMGNGEDALQVYDMMQDEGVVPNKLTYVAVLNACGNLAGLQKGKEIHSNICKNGLEVLDPLVTASLIAMYGKCGNMPDAQKVFDALSRRDVEAWNALIAGYALQGENELVFELFSSMELEGVQPDANTFLCVLTVCNHVGLVDTGQKYFEAMNVQYGIPPTIKHFTCLIDLLSRSGQLTQALELVNAMPFQADSVVWVCILGACQKWRDVDLARHAFQSAVKFNKNLPAAYALMSNIYYAAGMRNEAQEIQALRRKSQAWKQPGQSWCIDKKGTSHIFMVGDIDHRERHSIYAELEQLHKMATVDSVMAKYVCTEQKNYVYTEQKNYVYTEETLCHEELAFENHENENCLACSDKPAVVYTKLHQTSQINSDFVTCNHSYERGRLVRQHASTSHIAHIAVSIPHCRKESWSYRVSGYTT